jgi:hypothetical protein
MATTAKQREAMRQEAEARRAQCEACEHRSEGDIPEWEHMPDTCRVQRNPKAWTGRFFCFEAIVPCPLFKAKAGEVTR